jgi:N-formylglutamate deformylase
MPAARVVFPVSRLVCDVERFANDADEPMALRGMGAVYVKTSDEGPLREHLTPAERARLIELWYRPHHQRRTQTVDDVISDGKDCIIVACDSFSSRPLPHEPDQDPVRPDIRIGTDGWHTPERPRAEQVAARQRLAGFQSLWTGHSPARWSPASTIGREAKVQAVMIEINRRLYMDEATGGRLPSCPHRRDHSSVLEKSWRSAEPADGKAI